MRIDKKQIIQRIFLFASLSRESLAELAFLAELIEYKKQAVIYREDSPADFFYVVVQGRVVTYTAESSKQGKILEYLFRGTCFGIISLLTDDLHSVTAEAASDCWILRIPKEKFLKFAEQQPSLVLELSQTLSRRIKRRQGKGKNIFESSLIAVYSPFITIGKTTYAWMLAKHLAVQTGRKVMLLEVRLDDMFSLRREGLQFEKFLELYQFSEETILDFIFQDLGFHHLAVRYHVSRIDEEKRAFELLNFLGTVYNYVIVDLCSSEDKAIANFIYHSDAIHLLLRGELGFLRRYHGIVQRFMRAYSFTEDKVRLLLLSKKFPSQIIPYSQAIYAKLAFIEGLTSKKDLQEKTQTGPGLIYGSTVRNISRAIGNVRTGIAFGSGSAYGLSHIGVIKRFSELDIPVDIVSGSSMGSVIAALWAMGDTWETIKEKVGLFRKISLFSFFDINFSLISFFRGSTLHAIMRKLFGNKKFSDLRMPLRIVVFNFKRRSSYVLEKGYVWEAVLGSCAFPGIFMPVKRQQELLLDGGILNPLPTQILSRERVNRIIGVNVTPSREEILDAYKNGRLSHAFNIFDFIFGSIETMQRVFVEEAASFSDVIIHPLLADLQWTDFSKIDEYIERGYAAACAKEQEIISFLSSEALSGI